jgi:tetratricopeptide (TPR) repeat protein
MTRGSSDGLVRCRERAGGSVSSVRDRAAVLVFNHAMTDAAQRSRTLLIYLCLGLVTGAIYWPVRHFEFVYFDDPQYVVENRRVQEGLTPQGLAWAFTTFHAANWHPITWISHMLDWQIWGANAGAHHLVNVLFHIANTLLLFNVLDRMTRAPWRSALVAAFFAWHPLHVESVAWVAERKDVLSAFFWMLTIGAYIRYTERLSAIPRAQSTIPYYALALVFFALGLMSKPMLVTLPCVLLLLDFWPLGRTRWAGPAVSRPGPATGERIATSAGQLLKEKLPFFALAAASCAATYWAQQTSGAVVSLERVPLGMRMANAVLAYAGYLVKALWPMGLTYFYPVNRYFSLAASTIAAAGLVAVTAAVIRAARLRPWLATGWLWYLGTPVPVIGLIQVGSQSMADRYSYLPLVGLLILLGWSVPDKMVQRPGPKAALAVAAGASLGFYAALCRLQVGYWKNSETLLRHALQVTTDNWIAQNNLGLFLWRSGRVQEAIEHYTQALQINPNYAEAHHNLGLALLQQGKLPEAIRQFQEVTRIKPDSAEAHRRLGLALRQAGKLEEAIAQFELALRLKPDSPEAHNDLGNTLLGVGNLQNAIGEYGRALGANPDFVEAQNNLAWLLATLAPTQGGDPARAINLAQRACERTDNQRPECLDTLGAAYAAAGRFSNAIATAQKAVELARAAGRTELAGQIATRLDLYRHGQVYRPSDGAGGRIHGP